MSIQLTHAFDLTVIGPAAFASQPTPHSNLSAANGKAPLSLHQQHQEFYVRLTGSCTVCNGSLKSAEGTINIPVVAGADWMRIKGDHGDIDARVSCASPAGSEPQLQCDISYRGKIAFTETIGKVAKGEASSFEWGDVYYHTTPLIESRCEELAWVNKTVFVSVGKLGLAKDGYAKAEYRIYKIA
ncbi:hypothetical protein ACJZ2D_003364 [Fusarium nematophilum]